MFVMPRSANCARAVVPHMKRRRQGRICFISSVAGQLGVFGYGAYSASKFALRGLGEVLAMELKPYNVGISLSFPPDMNTPMFEQENKEKPWECHQISGKVEMQQPGMVLLPCCSHTSSQGSGFTHTPQRWLRAPLGTAFAATSSSSPTLSMASCSTGSLQAQPLCAPSAVSLARLVARQTV